jgi:lysozyme
MIKKLSPLILLLGVILLSTKGVHMASKSLKISQKGLDLIKKYEGYREHAYLCAGGQWTIGWGSTIVDGIKVKKGDVVDAVKADKALSVHLDTLVCPSVLKHIKAPLNQNQFDALCSFIYNTGEGGLRYYSSKAGRFVDTQVKQKLNAEDYQGAADALLAWDKVPTKTGAMAPLAGLTKRRQEERLLFLS